MVGTSITARGTTRPISDAPGAGVRVTDTGTVREVVLDRPSRKNALTVGAYRALSAALSDAAADDRLHVVVLSSSAGPFSVGNDFGDLLEGSQGAADGEEFARSAGTFLRALAAFPKPLVAAVGGLAAGVGATILLHCDVVIAATTAAFEFPATRLGLLPDAGASVLLPATLGLQRATEWLLFGERIDAQTALRLGLVNAVVERHELSSTALARADSLTRLPQSTVRELKRLLREPMRALIEEAITREIASMSASLGSAAGLGRAGGL
ncbi:MAG TPA: enoyl-CoA hydratase-related protein [Polyangiaceae bacterium]|nr:enoyl-CoA hydratase-related protein [Polyangiaceae bacterium]